MRRDYEVSTDGGWTWRALPKRTQPAAAISEYAACLPVTFGGNHPDPFTCMAAAVDPAAGRLAPLANQPPITVDNMATLGDGTLIVTGFDPNTPEPTGGFRSAVAVSVDDGRSWRTHTFRCGGASTVFARLEFTTAYVSNSCRSPKAGELARITGSGDLNVTELPTTSMNNVRIWVDGNGQPILEDGYAGSDDRPYYEVADGQWQRTALTMPPTWEIRPAPDGTYFAIAITSDGVIGHSRDARTWTALPVSVS